jgi:riboflavin synthase
VFTGIVEEIGRVRRWQGSSVTIEAGVTLEGSRVGDSIAVNGVCLTITALDGDAFSVHVSPETLHRTNLGRLGPGDPVDLERPLAYGGRVGGHLVQGHVDGTATLAAITRRGEGRLVAFAPPPRLLRYLVEKGFVAVDGVSLTVVERTPTAFTVAVIPYTWQHTVLGCRAPGDLVNIEVDILAKYVEQLVRGEAEEGEPA